MGPFASDTILQQYMFSKTFFVHSNFIPKICNTYDSSRNCQIPCEIKFHLQSRFPPRHYQIQSSYKGTFIEGKTFLKRKLYISTTSIYDSESACGLTATISKKICHQIVRLKKIRSLAASSSVIISDCFDLNTLVSA